ncbi:MAG: hypothetical protein U9R73_00505 [Pseudomonadota bacterium]|nr:hypothetical protein [Pseudomonadota bacterium]
MAELYDRARALVIRQLKEKGGDATLQRKARTHNPAARTVTETTTPVAIRAFLLKPESSRPVQTREETVARVRRAIIASTIAPKVGDIFVMKSISYPVKAFTEIAPDGDVIIYRLELGAK